MKKVKLKLLSLALCVCMCLSFFTGCSLVTTNKKPEDHTVALKIAGKEIRPIANVTVVEVEPTAEVEESAKDSEPQVEAASEEVA